MNLDLYNRIISGESHTAILSPRALWRLTGPDAARYLNGQVTSDITKLAEGHACYAAVCTAKGRMEGDVAIALRAGEFHLDADAVLRESLGARLDKFLIADDAVLEDVSDLMSLSHVFGKAVPEAPDSGFVVAYARFGLPGHDVWNAGPGAVIVGEKVDDALLKALRIEHAIPHWGAELAATTLPPEAGPHMLDAISYTKGCYVGQETIARLKSVGHVNRSLVLLQSDSATFPPVGAKLNQGGNEIGTVTSSCLSPRLKKGIALAYLQRQFLADGAVVRSGDLSLTVIPPWSDGASS
jgi:folate-binding protein YgfZ